MNLRKCSVCKQYFAREEMLLVGISAVCSSECFAETKQRKPKQKSNGAPDKERVPRAIRTRVRRRDGNACRYCGAMAGRIQVHHIHYRSEGGTDEEQNLITLCEEHHSLMHSDKGRWQTVLLFVMQAQYERRLFLTVLDAERLLTMPPDC